MYIRDDEKDQQGMNYTTTDEEVFSTTAQFKCNKKTVNGRKVITMSYKADIEIDNENLTEGIEGLVNVINKIQGTFNNLNRS